MTYRFSPASPLASLGLEMNSGIAASGSSFDLPAGEAALFVRTGRLSLESEGKRRFECAEASCLLVPGRARSRSVEARGEKNSFTLLAFEADPLPALRRTFALGVWARGLPSPWAGGSRLLEPAPAAPGILATLDSALGAAALPVSSLRPDRAAEYLAAASLSQLLALLLEAGSRIGEATQTRGGAVPDSPAGRGGEEGRPWTIEELRAWIDTHYEESFTLEEMVGRCALNTSDFSRRFKDATGSPLFEYLNRRRVSRAALLLRDGELPITEIAFSVGYNNLSFFNRYFLRLMGMTPGEYRRRNR